MADGVISSSWRHQIREKFVELGSTHVEPLIEPYIEQFSSNGDKRQTRRNIIHFAPIPHTDIARVSSSNLFFELILRLGDTIKMLLIYHDDSQKLR